ncbi:MAG: 3'-5' exonuclease [Caldisericia bacterium]|nr:3'-5' exonuclease [Caldisericia bacterium]
MKESNEITKHIPAFLLFDFETTGFNPPGDKPVQLAYIKLNAEFAILEAKNFYFQVQEEVPESASKIHGLTKDKLIELKAGTIEEYREEICKDFTIPGIIPIAHNAQFDMKFIKEFFVQDPIKYFCTMNYYTNIVKLPGRYGKYKWPKVSETISFLKVNESKALKECQKHYGKETIGFHDARFDIVCILKMVQEDKVLTEALINFGK